VLAIVENVGNIEIDGMTVGFTINKDDDGWGAIILHGKYDSARVYAAAKKAMADEATPDGEKPAEKPSDIPCLDIEHGEIQVLFPDNERVVVTAGPREKAAKIRDTFVASLKRGNGGLAGNKELGDLIKTVDTHSPVWIAAKLTETMQTDIFAGFKTIAMDSKPTREGVSFTFRGTGGDEKEVTAAVERMDGGIKAGLASAQAEVADNPTLKPAADFMASLKLSRDGKSATLTGEIKAQVLDSMLGELGLLSQMIVRPAPPVIIEDPVPVVPK
ncbi:MAG TPA: hypothetical protein VHM90_06040, partial [Phycisphaerae bacterium]|nr:hypothetical protein [Phycisphaerae bacterium]